MAPEGNTDIYLFHFRKYDNMSTRETNMVIIVLFICFRKCKLNSEAGEKMIIKWKVGEFHLQYLY